MVKVPVQSLSVEALRGVVEAFVLREGTDYGHRDIPLKEKCAAVERQIAAGEAEVWFDPESRTTDIRPVSGSGAARREAKGDESDDA